MAESQNSTSSSSDKDSLQSSEKNISEVSPNFDDRKPEADLTFIDDEYRSEQVLSTEDECGPNVCLVKMDDRDAVKPSQYEQRSIVESRQTKTIKNIMMALKEGNKRESSPIRSNHVKLASASTQRTNIEVASKIPRFNVLAPALKSNPDAAAIAPSKVAPDSAKRIHVSHLVKHQVFL